MEPVLSVSEPSEILSLIPYQIGYEPRESVVLIALRGPRQRVGVMARADGMAFVQDSGSEVMAAMVDFILHDKAHRALAVLYCESNAAPPWIDRVCELLAHYVEKFLSVDVWWLSGTTLKVGQFSTGRIEGDRPSVLWPSRGCDVGDLRATQVSATMTYAGARIFRDRSHMALLPQLSADTFQERVRCADSWRVQLQHSLSPEVELEEVIHKWYAVIQSLGTADKAMTSLDFGVVDECWGQLGISLLIPTVRDVVIAMILSYASEDSPKCAHEKAIPKSSDIGGIIRAAIRPEGYLKPRYDVLDRCMEAVGYATASVRRDHRFAGLAVLALMAWWGSGTVRAKEYVRQALAIDPSHTLANLVAQMLDSAIAPGWVIARRDSSA